MTNDAKPMMERAAASIALRALRTASPLSVAWLKDGDNVGQPFVVTGLRRSCLGGAGPSEQRVWSSMRATAPPALQALEGLGDASRFGRVTWNSPRAGSRHLVSCTAGLPLSRARVRC